MKKIICLMLVGVMLIFSLVSCVSGESIPYNIVRLNNSIENTFKSGYLAFDETLVYSDGTKLSYYYEISKNGFSYNLIEKINDDYSLYCYEGDILINDNNNLTSVVLLKGIYSDFINKYMDNTHTLDSGDKYQVYSQKSNGKIEVQYKAKITPKMISELSEYNLNGGEYIFSKYIVDTVDYRINTIEYYIGTEENSRLVLTRSFNYYNERQDLFSTIQNLEKITLSLSYVDNRVDTQKVFKGAKVAFYLDESSSFSFFTDESLSILFDNLNTKIETDLTLFVRKIDK